MTCALAAIGTSFWDASPKTGGASVPPASAHHDQFGGETIHRFVVSQGIEDPVSKRACVVQVGLEKVGVLGEGVLPITYPIVRPSVLLDDPVDHLCPLFGGGIRLKGAYHLEWRSHTQGIYPNPPKKSQVIHEESSFGNFLGFLFQFPALEDPFFQNYQLMIIEPIPLRRHPLILVSGRNEGKQMTFRGFARHDGGQTRFPPARRFSKSSKFKSPFSFSP